MEEKILPTMPIDFSLFADQVMPLVTNVIGSIAPYMIVYVLGLVGIRYMKNVFQGRGVVADAPDGKPWDNHSEAMYEWYKESIERKGVDYFDENAPEWVKARIEYEQTYDEIAELERKKQLRKSIRADIKRDLKEGKDVFGKRKYIPVAAKDSEWYGDEDNDEEEE